MTDEQLGQLLREALPQSNGRRADGDLWPRVAARFNAHRSWAWLDLGLAAAVAALLLMFPECLSLLAHHL